MRRSIRSAAIADVQRLALQQLGLFTVEQARAIGIPRQTIAYHSEAGGEWERVLPSVYQLAQLAPDSRRPLLAALLWAGPDAVLSHRSAASLLRFDGIGEPQPELCTTNSKTAEGVIVHRVAVPRRDIATTGMLRHTNAVRTVVDLAQVLDDDTLEFVVESALRTNRRRERELLAATQMSRRGSRTLARVLARRGPGTPATESELETRYIQLLRRADVPPPTRQHNAFDELGRFLGRLDLCWPEARLWVELDGREWHDRPDALFRDRRRQNDIVAALHWLPLRFTWRDVVGRPAETAAKTETVYHRRLACLGSPRDLGALSREPARW
jgi:hypothetical protein